NAYTTSNQSRPSVASDSLTGNFVVVWTSDTKDGSSYGVFGQRFASSGNPLGPEFRVNTYTTNDQSRPVVAADSSGNVVVVWQSGLPTGSGQDGSVYGVFGQRYASSGAPLGPEFRVNTYTTDHQNLPSIAAGSANFVVTWESYGSQDGASWGVFGQRYASSGAPLGPEFRVNTFTTSYQTAPSIAADSSGNFVVVWHGIAQDGSSFGVFAQRFASSGAPLGPEFGVNTYTTNSQYRATVAADPATGNFVVVWRSETQDG